MTAEMTRKLNFGKLQRILKKKMILCIRYILIKYMNDIYACKYTHAYIWVG